MSSITTAVAADYRLQQWTQLVKECQNRPSDMTVEQWCDTKGISKSNYYYRLQRIRKACLEHIPEDSLPCQQVVELSENIMHLPESTPDISIEIKGCIVRVHGDISEALLEKTVRVLSHVK